MGFKMVRWWAFFRCKLNALNLSYILMFQVHLPVRLPCYDFPHLAQHCACCLGILLGSRRVTGGVYALRYRLQLGILSQFTAKSGFDSPVFHRALR